MPNIIKRDGNKGKIMGFKTIDKATCNELGGEYNEKEGICYLEVYEGKDGKLIRKPLIEIKDSE